LLPPDDDAAFNQNVQNLQSQSDLHGPQRMNAAPARNDQSALPDAEPETTMAMPLPTPSPAPANSASLEPTLRVIVGLIGAIEILNGLTDLSILFGELSKIPAGFTTLAAIILRPVLAGAALIFALTRRLRYGIAALALWAFVQWASDMPSDFSLELGGDALMVGTMAFKTFVQPAFALAAIAAVWFNRYLVAATLAVMLPTVVDIAGLVAFTIGVSLHGF
jgi:hypothetical protein